MAARQGDAKQSDGDDSSCQILTLAQNGPSQDEPWKISTPGPTEAHGFQQTQGNTLLADFDLTGTLAASQQSEPWKISTPGPTEAQWFQGPPANTQQYMDFDLAETFKVSLQSVANADLSQTHYQHQLQEKMPQGIHLAETFEAGHVIKENDTSMSPGNFTTPDHTADYQYQPQIVPPHIDWCETMNVAMTLPEPLDAHMMMAGQSGYLPMGQQCWSMEWPGMVPVPMMQGENGARNHRTPLNLESLTSLSSSSLKNAGGCNGSATVDDNECLVLWYKWKVDCSFFRKKDKIKRSPAFSLSVDGSDYIFTMVLEKHGDPCDSKAIIFVQCDSSVDCDLRVKYKLTVQPEEALGADAVQGSPIEYDFGKNGLGKKSPARVKSSDDVWLFPTGIRGLKKDQQSTKKEQEFCYVNLERFSRTS